MALADQQLTEEEQIQAARSLRDREAAGSADPAQTGTIGDQINAGEQRRAGRQLRQDRQQSDAQPSPVAADRARAQSFGGRLREARQAIRALGNAPETLRGAAEDLAREAVIQAQRRMWGLAMEVTEDITITIWPLAFVLGFIPVTLFVVRAVMAYPLRAFFRISFRGFELPLAPTFSGLDFALRIKGALAYLIWGLEWVLLIVVYNAITYCGDHPTQCLFGS